jgi:S-disulfanyl-L-cysteine oxidoreductase SoxD
MRRDGKPDTKNVACMTNCVTEVKLSSEMPDYARDSHGNLAEQARLLGDIEGVPTGPRATRAAATSKAPSAQELARKSGCLACHGVSSKIVGPALRDIATKYAGNAGAAAALLAKVKTGGSGVWGPVAMPPQPQVKEADASTVIAWILAGAR